jgi:hypothetical protein
MLLNTIRFVSMLCAALVLGLTLTHVLEIPGKSQLSGAEWLTVQHSFYGGFAIVGGLAEIVGLLSSGVLAYLLRQRRIPFILALVAALSFAGTLAAFAFGNSPLNQQIASWTPQTLPTNWQTVRDTWDRIHAFSSLLGGIALASLLIALIRDTPQQCILSLVKPTARTAADVSMGASER